MNRRIGVAASIVFTVAACAPALQGGSPDEAREAADAFLQDLADGDADAAWSHLTPPTRRSAYEDDADAFAREVAAADWSEFEWDIGPVTNHDISWGVHVLIEEESVPDFLVNRGIAGGWDGSGIVLLVQIPSVGGYWIAGQGLDTRLDS